jgi:hypothetical protein
LSATETVRNHAAFVWSVADLLRGDYKQSEYGRVILPMVVLHRLDCVLHSTKDKVLGTAANLAGKLDNVEPVLRQAAGERFYNTSPLTMPRLLDDPPNLADNLHRYLQGFSPDGAPPTGGTEVPERHIHHLKLLTGHIDSAGAIPRPWRRPVSPTTLASERLTSGGS